VREGIYMETTTTILIQSLLFQFIIQLVPIVIVALIAWFMISKILKKVEKQHLERLAFEKENAHQISELNVRLSVIEKLLKEVD